MQSKIFTAYIFYIKKCNFKPVLQEPMLCSGVCVPGSGFSREAAVLLRLTGALRCWGRAGAKGFSLHRRTEMGKTPWRISVLLSDSKLG